MILCHVYIPLCNTQTQLNIVISKSYWMKITIYHVCIPIYHEQTSFIVYLHHYVRGTYYIEYAYRHIGSDHDLVIMTFRVRLKKARKPNQPRQRFDLEKLREPDVACTFQATIGGKFAPLIGLSDEDMDIDTMITTYNTAVTDAASEILGKERRRKKPWVTKDVLDLCDERRDLKKKRYEAEGAKEYKEANRRIQ